MAERLYYDSSALEFTAEVTDIRLVATERRAAGPSPEELQSLQVSQLWQVALDRTAFYPEGGGQPWDVGVLVATARSGATLEVAVERVEEDAAGEVWHSVRKPLVAGTAVRGRVDAERRRDHTQQHSGQHLLSAVFLTELGARTVSFHLGAETATIDLLLPEGMREIRPEQLEAVETEANRLIFENRPMVPRWHSREEAEAMLAAGQLRKLPERAGPMRVVEMAGVEFNACGGTHVSATGAIGGLLLRRLEKAKAGWRVEFLCGGRAVRAARQDFEQLGTAARAVGSPTGELAGRIMALRDQVKSLGKDRVALKRALAIASANEMCAFEVPGTLKTPIYAEDLVFVKDVALQMARHGFPALVTANADDGGMVLALPAGSALNAGEIMREAASELGLRAGGSAEIAQCGCPGEQAMNLKRLIFQRYFS